MIRQEINPHDHPRTCRSWFYYGDEQEYDVGTYIQLALPGS